MSAIDYQEIHKFMTARIIIWPFLLPHAHFYNNFIIVRAVLIAA